MNATVEAPVASDVARTVPDRPRGWRALAVASRLKPSGVLGWLTRVAAVILVLQLAFLVTWSFIEWRGFDLTYDFFVYLHNFHAFWADGLNPFNSTAEHLSLANNGTLIVWPLAVLTSVYPHGVVLLLIQDLALVAAEAVALTWIAEALRGSALARSSPRLTRCLFGLGLVLLVANPWIYWSNAYDFHIEVFGVLFILLATRDLMRRRWGRMTLWVVLTLACGFVAATYVIGLAVTALIVGGGRRLAGGVILVGGALLVLLAVLDPQLSGGFNAQVVSSYGYLAGGGSGATGVGQVIGGALTHPGLSLGALWSSRADVMANLAPSGLVGLASPWVFGVVLSALLPNELNRFIGLSAPGFQSMAIYILVPIGTVLILASVALRGPRRRALTGVLAAMLCVETLAWAFVVLPLLPSKWLTVSPTTAAVLARVDARVPQGVEVIASQGIMGRFATRPSVYPITGPGPVPVGTGPVWFVVVPSQGSATVSAAVGSATVAELSGPLHAQLVVSGSGVWAFRWVPPVGVHSVNIPGGAK